MAAKLAKVVGIICQLLHDLTCQDVVGQDEAGREVVRLAAMPKTAVVHAQVRTAAAVFSCHQHVSCCCYCRWGRVGISILPLLRLR